MLLYFGSFAYLRRIDFSRFDGLQTSLSSQSIKVARECVHLLPDICKMFLQRIGTNYSTEKQINRQ